MSTIPKRKHECSDIEANYRNETKTFWFVPEFFKTVFFQVLSQPLLELSWPQQHSHSREKVLVNSLLQANWVLVDCRGLESALEAVRVSVEAVRVSVEAVRVSIEALRCFRGRERLEEVPENVNWGHESVRRGSRSGWMTRLHGRSGRTAWGHNRHQLRWRSWWPRGSDENLTRPIVGGRGKRSETRPIVGSRGKRSGEDMAHVSWS